MRSRTARTITCLVLTVFLLFPSVLAVGFANPPRDREILFQPGETVEIPIYVVGANSIRASLTSPDRGDPATLGTPEDDNILEYVRIDDPAPLTGQRRVMLIFTFPDRLAPDVYDVDVVSAETSGNGEGISARAAMKMRFNVRVLSDEKLLEVTRLRVQAIPEGLNTSAQVFIVSRTNSPIQGAKATIHVYDGDELVTSSQTTAVPLARAEEKVLTTPLSTSHLVGGAYKVNATVSYDEGREAYSPRAVFSVGTLHVDVTEYSEELTYNATNKFLFKVDNLWNREIRNVEATLIFGDQTKETPRQNIPAFSKSEAYEVYFDRDPTVQPGKSIVNVTVDYQDYDPETGNYRSAVDEILLDVNVVAPPEEEAPSPLPTSMIIMYILLGALILLLAIVLIVLLKRRRNDSEPSYPGAGQ